MNYPEFKVSDWYAVETIFLCSIDKNDYYLTFPKTLRYPNDGALIVRVFSNLSEDYCYRFVDEPDRYDRTTKSDTKYLKDYYSARAIAKKYINLL